MVTSQCNEKSQPVEANGSVHAGASVPRMRKTVLGSIPVDKRWSGICDSRSAMAETAGTDGVGAPQPLHGAGSGTEPASGSPGGEPITWPTQAAVESAKEAVKSARSDARVVMTLERSTRRTTLTSAKGWWFWGICASRSGHAWHNQRQWETRGAAQSQKISFFSAPMRRNVHPVGATDAACIEPTSP